jgi:hypothetical protein
MRSLLLAPMLLAGCATTPDNDERGPGAAQRALIERATFDMECAHDQLTFSKLGDWTRVVNSGNGQSIERATYGVRGCGKKAAYLIECTKAPFSERKCNAALNSDASAGDAQ